MSDCSKHKAILLVNKNHYEVSRYCIDADEQFAKYFADGEIKKVEQKSLSDL